MEAYMSKLALVLAVMTLLSAAACGGDDDNEPSRVLNNGSASFTFLGFSDHAAAENHAPPDVVRSGGTLKACDPSRLYAFVSFSGLQPPKEFVGNWTLNGAPLSRRSFSQTLASAETFWEVQNTPMPLTAGAYRFQLTIDGNAVSEGSFTLTC
jgi:hypothetical protein